MTTEQVNRIEAMDIITKLESSSGLKDLEDSITSLDPREGDNIFFTEYPEKDIRDKAKEIQSPYRRALAFAFVFKATGNTNDLHAIERARNMIKSPPSHRLIITKIHAWLQSK